MATSYEYDLISLSHHLNFDIDLFICSSSFESRSLSIANQIKTKDFSAALICHYKNSYQSANENYDRLVELLIATRISNISFIKDDPLTSLDNLVAGIKEFTDKNPQKATCNILLDITTFTHEMVFILIYLFKIYLKPPSYNLKIVYTPASAYSTDETKEEDKWLSKGVGEIRSVLGYSGQMTPSKKTLLIILVGYEFERVKSIIELFEPSKVLLGHASREGAINNNLLGKNVSTFQTLKQILQESMSVDTESFEFTCREPAEVEAVLTPIIKKYGESFNIKVASLNNKISTIGCALVGLKYAQIQICYPVANQYNHHHYSLPGNKVFLIDINV